MSKMQEANTNGINVISELSSDASYIYDNKKTRYVLKNVIGEDEDCTTFVNSNEHRYTMRAKGSHSFV